MDEKQWLQNKIDELRKYVGLIITEYDDGLLTRNAADTRIAIMCKDSMSTTYDHAFAVGVASAELTGDDSEPEVEIDFSEDHPE
jgi:hypothetical protein